MRNALLVITAAWHYGLAAAPAQAQSFDCAVAFGDSLSEGGNFSDILNLPPAYFTLNPRLTAVGAYGSAIDPSRPGGDNYAYGGALMLVQALQAAAGRASPRRSYRV